MLRPGRILHLQEWEFFVGATPNAIRAWLSVSPFASGSEKAEGSTLGQCPRLRPLRSKFRENVKVGLPFPPGLVTSATQAFIKGARAVLLYGWISLEECMQLELDVGRDILYHSTLLRLNCVWAQKPVQQLYEICNNSGLSLLRTVQAGSVHKPTEKRKRTYWAFLRS